MICMAMVSLLEEPNDGALMKQSESLAAGLKGDREMID